MLVKMYKYSIQIREIWIEILKYIKRNLQFKRFRMLSIVLDGICDKSGWLLTRKTGKSPGKIKLI